MKNILPALTFDDVSLVPGYSEILPSQVDVSTQLGKNLKLPLPILSAAMDTVTESQTAITMAQNGGIGIIHKNSTIEYQAKEVKRVKKFEAGVVFDPVVISRTATVEEALNLMNHHGIGGFPVVEDGLLVGIVTRRDLRFAANNTDAIERHMTTNVITAEKDSDPAKCFALMRQHKIEKLPLVNKQGALQGLVTVRDLQKINTAPQAVRDQQGRLLCGAAIGPGDDLEARAQALVEAGVDVLVLDTAHGHSKKVAEAVEKVRAWYPDIFIIAGNIVTKEAAEMLIKAGANAVKVGVGPGSICTTRIVSGVGVPQFSAIMEVAQVTKKMGATLIADGGIKFSGDMVKAIAAGADAIMVGSLFAGTEEAPGERVLFQGRAFKVYRGMGSLDAMQSGSKDRYAQSDVSETSKLVPEGIEGRVPYRGPLSAVIYQLVGGMRTGMGYVGSRTIAELHEKARFVSVTAMGLRESHVHDVTITKEAPNYQQSN